MDSRSRIMFFSSREIVWMPDLTAPLGVGVILHPDFAEACRNSGKDSEEFAEGVWRLLGNTPPVTPSNFIDFLEGLLPQGFYAGRDGLWLTLKTPVRGVIESPLVYEGHNDDNFAADRLWILRVFGAWATGAMMAVDWK